MICCLLKLFSSSTATSDSSILRRHLRSRVRKSVRASCIEIVEPPSFIRPARRSSSAARAMPMASMPPWRKKLLSSEASSACSTSGGISPSLSIIRRSRAKEAKTLPSAAKSCVTRFGVKLASAPTCGTWMSAATLTPTEVPTSTATSSGQVQRIQGQRRLRTPGTGRRFARSPVTGTPGGSRHVSTSVAGLPGRAHCLRKAQLVMPRAHYRGLCGRVFARRGLVSGSIARSTASRSPSIAACRL